MNICTAVHAWCAHKTRMLPKAKNFSFLTNGPVEQYKNIAVFPFDSKPKIFWVFFLLLLLHIYISTTTTKQNYTHTNTNLLSLTITLFLILFTPTEIHLLF